MRTAFEKAKSAYGTGAYDDATMEFLFPQLKESEDERIRKWIVELLHKLHYNQTAQPMALKAIEWLEKQKEQKPVEKQDYSGLSDFEARLMDCMCAAQQYRQGEISWNVVEKWAEELIELCPQQKPVEWSDTNELVFKDICKHLKEEGYNGWIVLLEALRNGEFNQPSVEWSEEDEAMLKEIISFFKDGSVKLQHDLDLYAGFLEKRLKSPRPQKLDASKLENFDPVEVLNRIKMEWPMAWEKVVWKPSDEQMNELRKVLIPGETFDCDILIGLLERLEELM